ncbi:unnamed protein product, partial [Phaeothamnion confervicola]
AGLLKACESSGYAIREPQPSEIRPELFDFQRSTVQWMLDRERDEAGINGFFWQRRDWADTAEAGGSPLYYFPLAGEFRLTRPPLVRGGLLAEEMGLGKTVEILSLIVRNRRVIPADAELDSHGRPVDDRGRLLSRGTLIVVPVTLVGQWRDEVAAAAAMPVSATAAATLLGGHVGAAPIAISKLLAAIASTGGDGVAAGDDAVAAAAAVAISEAEVIVTYKLEGVLHEMDVILTTYDSLRCEGRLKKINWHRVILDECQEIKTATTQVATLCQALHAENRWMVSGTPLASSINDLHGELAFLGVWPFSLQNDGFWEGKVAAPYRSRSEEGLDLLLALLRV